MYKLKKKLFIAGLLSLLATLFLTTSAFAAVAATPPTPPTPPPGPPEVTTTITIMNVSDSGEGGNIWGNSTVVRTTQMWPTGGGEYYVQHTDVNTTTTYAGTSPGNGGTVEAGVTVVSTGYRIETVKGIPAVTSGDLGTHDLGCTQVPGTCTQPSVNLIYDIIFGGSGNWSDAKLVLWSWLYAELCSGQTWLNQDRVLGGNDGDIVGGPFSCGPAVKNPGPLALGSCKAYEVIGPFQDGVVSVGSESSTLLFGGHIEKVVFVEVGNPHNRLEIEVNFQNRHFETRSDGKVVAAINFAINQQLERGLYDVFCTGRNGQAGGSVAQGGKARVEVK